MTEDNLHGIIMNAVLSMTSVSFICIALYMPVCLLNLQMKDVEVWQSYFSPEEGRRGQTDEDPEYLEPKNKLTFIKSLEQFPLR
jgi:hypothetical protein